MQPKINKTVTEPIMAYSLVIIGITPTLNARFLSNTLPSIFHNKEIMLFTIYPSFLRPKTTAVFEADLS
jgi:hypothetical protein